MIKCPECKSNISNLAITCPKCGFPISDNQMKVRVGIPAIPEEIYLGLRKAAISDDFLKWKIVPGEWVEEGQELASYSVKSFNAKHFARGKIQTVATINAPISGKIYKINYSIQYFKWNWNDLERYDMSWGWRRDNDSEYDHLKEENILLAIDSPKESLYDILSSYISAYTVYENIVDYGYFASAKSDANPFLNFWNFLRGSMFDSEDFPKMYLEGLANSSLRVEKINTKRE